MRRLVVILMLFVTLALGVYYYNSSPLGKPFSLDATDGRVVTLSDLHEKPSLIFFGYTHCPDFCPVTFLELSFWLEDLKINSSDLNIWFFTVDPERDTIEVLKDYIENFSDQIVGISGEKEAQYAAIKSLGAVWEKVYADTKNKSDYTLNHTAGFTLLKKGGKLHSHIPFGEDPKISMGKIRDLLRQTNAAN